MLRMTIIQKREPMSDLIDRQALLKQIDIDSDGEPGYYGDTWKFIDTIKNMPNVHDLPKDTDTISRQAAIDALKQQAETMSEWSERYAEQRKGVLTAVNIVEDLPPAQPERIIRCKDCKHWIPYDWMFSEVWQSKNMADYPEDEIGCNYCDVAMKANDFCSRGERREVTT